MDIGKVKNGIYWVGGIDWNLRNFHGYTTNRGSTYGAYLILDDKVTLIDAVKPPFAKELIDRISEIIEPSRIDYIISNHVEMDHSGAIPKIMEYMPKAVIVTSSPSGLKGLKAHYGDNYNYMPVISGSSLSLGKRTLEFIPTPMLHWPDNMITYCPEEKILFSNDAFGQHYASNKHFDDEININQVFLEAKKYYANIIMPYGSQVEKVLETVRNLDIEIIAPSHGIMWRKYIKQVLDLYEKWCGPDDENKAVVVYDSMWHSTETMACSIEEVFSKAGKEVFLFDLKETHISDIMMDVLNSKYIAVGCPTLNNNMLPTVAGFLMYLKGLTVKNKKAFAFGSYGWGGQSIGQVEDALKNCGYEIMCDMFRINYIPDKETLEKMQNTIIEKL